MPVVSKIVFKPFPDFRLVFQVKYTTASGRFTVSFKDVLQKNTVMRAVAMAVKVFDAAELEKVKCALCHTTEQLTSASEDMLRRVISVASTCFRSVARSVEKVIVVGTKLETSIEFTSDKLVEIAYRRGFSDDIVCWDVYVGVYQRESYVSDLEDTEYSYEFLRDHPVRVFGTNISDDHRDVKFELKTNPNTLVVIPFTERNVQIVSKWLEEKITTLMGMCVQNPKVRNELLTAVGLPVVKQKSAKPAKKVVSKTTEKSAGNPKGKRRE